MKRLQWEQVLFGVGTLLLLASLAGFLAGELYRTRHAQRPARDNARRAAGYVRTEFATDAPPARPWQAPAAQPRGPGWIFDLFTPPEVGCEAATLALTAIPPRAPRISEDPELELLAVRRAPFRWQLRGHLGGAGEYRGVFENLGTGEVILAGVGRVAAEPGLTVAELRVWRAGEGFGHGADAGLPGASAVVRDELTGQSATLVEGECCYAGPLSAVVAAGDDEEAARLELREGEEFRNAELSYRVECLQLDPPRAELIRTSAPSARPSRVTLAAQTVAGATN